MEEEKRINKCILCGEYKENSNLFCDKCHELDWETRMAALQRNEQLSKCFCAIKAIAFKREEIIPYDEYIKYLKSKVKTIGIKYIGADKILEDQEKKYKNITRTIRNKERNREDLNIELREIENRLKMDISKKEEIKLNKK